MMTIANPFKQ